MRKIPRDLENPVDNSLLEAADASLPFVRALGLTPNQVTVGSISLALVAVFELANGRPWTFAASYCASIFLDYVDGHYARSDDMVSKVGDFMDHWSDAMLAVGIVAALAWKLRFPRALLPIGTIAVFGFLQAVHLGYQQKWFSLHGETSGTHEESLDVLKNLSPGDPDEAMKFTRYFGVGTYHAALLVVVLAFGFGSRSR